jgi:hypothetical protein
MGAERLAGVLIEDRPPSLNIEVPAIAAQLENPAAKTRPGVVATALEEQGIPVFFVDLPRLRDDKITAFRRLDPTTPDGFRSYEVHEGTTVQILAARIRDWLGDSNRDPAVLPEGYTYNSRQIREDLVTRVGVKAWLDRWLSERFRIPHEIIVRDSQVPQLPKRFSDFMVKPLRATETTEDKHRRAAVASRTAIQAQVDATGGEAVIQPRLKNVQPGRLVRKLGLYKLGVELNLDRIAPDAHNEVTIYHTPGPGSRAAVAELKFHNPHDIGSLYGTWSMPFDMQLLCRALPGVKAAYEQLARGLDEDYLGLCNVGVKLVLSTNWRRAIKAHISGVSLRPFTPDADQGGDQYRQHYADLLAQTEINALAALARSNPQYTAQGI